jgi:transcriptional regulator with XRE-family HTH domain
MENIKEIIVNNLIKLRKQNNLTQAQLAEKLNYSDKAISRWEKGEALPDIDVLCNICDMYGVSFDYLTHKENNDYMNINIEKNKGRNHLLISLLSISGGWLLFLCAYLLVGFFGGGYIWQLILWAVPLSFLLAMIFNIIWGKRINTFIFMSFLLWSFITCFYLQIINLNIWPIFIIGIPLQIAIILWSAFKPKPKQKN